jgi:hypothetical protein
MKRRNKNLRSSPLPSQKEAFLRMEGGGLEGWILVKDTDYRWHKCNLDLRKLGRDLILKYYY